MEQQVKYPWDTSTEQQPQPSYSSTSTYQPNQNAHAAPAAPSHQPQQTPPPPSNLRAATQGTRIIALSWQAPQQGLEYRIYRSETPWSCYGLIAETKETQHIDHAPEAATKYYYFVQSVAAGRTSQASPMAEALTFPALTMPDAPQGLQAQANTPNSIALRWNHARSAAAYIIYARTNPHDDFCAVGHSLDCSWQHENLPQDSMIEYCVQAYHDSGASALSNPCTARSGMQLRRPSTPSPMANARRFPVFSPQVFQR